ncbi:MAG TPA: hypothetical protein VM490_20195, partial [Armatimonadaceae bacterium]|nr:hypothetical protein [Armatimonadaceae bacterium]
MYADQEESNAGESSLTRAGIAFAAIVIVGLLFLCLRFALDSASGDRRAGAVAGTPRGVVSAPPRS